MIGDNMKVNIYGAGNYAKYYLPKLIDKFDIVCVFDLAEQKQGTYIHDIQIRKPSQSEVNAYPVMILLHDIQSAFRTLKDLGCTQKIYGFLEYAGGFGFYLCDKGISLEALIRKGYWFQNLDRDFALVMEQETTAKYISDQIRYFNIASPVDFYAAGGPCACLRNLYIANEEFHLIDNFYTLCPSTAYIPKDAPVNKIKAESLAKLKIESVLTLSENENNLRIEDEKEFLWLNATLQALVGFLKKADAKFCFTEKDVFLLQDPYIVEAFINLFPDFNKVITAYHVQGTLQSELGKRFPALKQTLNRMQENHLNRIKKWIFPSKGAAEGFLNTGTEVMRQNAEKCDFFVAYNGYEMKETIQPDSDFCKQLEQIKDADVIFASATFLYRNKGVERIPKVLAEFKKQTGLKIHWILIGSGEMEEEVEMNIHRYLEDGEYTWYHMRFENQDNVFALFLKADFYIMMHRVSVFDLSTLQAMAYSCVPILSGVGGNKELCGFGNGILIHPEEACIDLTGYMEGNIWHGEYLERQKKLNSKIIRETFNNKAFLEGYKNVLYQEQNKANADGQCYCSGL